MHDSIAVRLALLPELSKSDLHKLWKELFQKQPPEKLRRDLLIPILGYRLQELEFRPLSPDVRRKLSAAVQAITANPKAEILSSASIKPGTRLVRQWQDKVHIVHVEETGYEYKGSRYESLSEIARLITGTRWSGPLFFGLKSRPPRDSQEAL
jgi:hypothetical protein